MHVEVQEKPIKELVEALQRSYANRQTLQREEKDLREYLSFELLDKVERAYVMQKSIIRKHGLYRMFPKLIGLRLEATLCAYAILAVIRVKPEFANPLVKRIDVYAEAHTSWI